VSLLLLAGCAVVNVPEAMAPGEEFDAVRYATEHTVHLKGSGCSAVMVGADRLVTAKHCVPDDAKAGDSYEGGTLLHISPAYDFAVVQIRDPKLRIVLKEPRAGEHLYVVGYPVQLGSSEQVLTVTDGICAGPVDSDGQWRITAPVYFGNSGGGVWSDNGELLGIAVSIYAAPMDGLRPMPYAAQSFMVPASVVTPWL
jgi:S1-C subfamily serine protease